MRNDVKAALALALGVGLEACAAAPAAPVGQPVATALLTYDDGRGDGEVSFPDTSYECVLRFAEEPRTLAPRRLWWRARAAGRVRITIYASSPLDGPGEPLWSVERELGPEHTSDGHDDRWLVESLPGLAPTPAPLWVGFRQLAGKVTLWASARDSGRYFMRSHAPGRATGLLPVRRSPLVRLEVAP